MEQKSSLADICTLTKYSSGEACTSPRCRRSRSLVERLARRQYGSPYPYSFTRAEKCYVNNQLLPVVKSRVDRYRSKVFCSKFINDGDLLISACQDGRIGLYECQNFGYKRPRVVQAQDVGWSVLDLAVSPAGTHVAYSSWSYFLHQFRIGGDEQNHLAFRLHPREYHFCVFSMRFSHSGDEILAGGSDRCLYIYDLIRNSQALQVLAHRDDVNSVAYADMTSQIFFTGSDDGLLKVWDRRMLSDEYSHPVGILAGHLNGITFIDSKGDTRYLISNSKDQSIKLWDIRKFSSLETVKSAVHTVASQCWDYRWQSNARKVPSVSDKPLDGDVSVMTYKGGHTVLHTLIRCFFSPMHSSGQKYIYCGSATGCCTIYDVTTGKVVSCLKGHRSCVRDVSWHPYQGELCTSSWDGAIYSWKYGCSDSVNNENNTFSESSSESLDEYM